MFQLKYLSFGLTVCILLTSGCEALSVKAGSVDDLSTSPEDAAGLVQDDSPADPAVHHADILSILGKLKGGNELETMESLVKGYSAMRIGLKFIFNYIPLFRRVFETASKSNAAFRTIVKVMQGRVPDVVDLYDLATNSRQNHMSSDVITAENKDEQYRHFNYYLRHRSTLNSSTDINNMVKLLTGKDVSISQQVVDAVNEGNMIVTKDNLGQANMFYAVDFLIENRQTLNYSLSSLAVGQHSNMFMNILSIIGGFDLSPLTKMKVMTQNLDDDKYSINKGQPAFIPDPHVTTIVSDLANVKKMSKERNVDDSKVVSLVTEVLQHMTHLFERILDEATRPTDSSSNSLHSADG